MEDEVIQEPPSVSSEESSCCPICLGPMVQDSYLDKCFHKFCYNCILRWGKVLAGKHNSPSSITCPLCKTESFSIIYEFDGINFQRHSINHDFGDSFILSKDHRFRLQCYYTEQGVLDDIFNISQYWKSCKYCQPNRWLQSWLKREIQALIQEEDVDIIVHHILGSINASFTRMESKSHSNNAHEKKQEEFRISISEAARPFLAARTERFVYELQLFLASGLNIEAFDAVYRQRFGWSSPGANTQASQSECIDRTTIIRYLYVFDEDSDGNE